MCDKYWAFSFNFSFFFYVYIARLPDQDQTSCCLSFFGSVRLAYEGCAPISQLFDESTFQCSYLFQVHDSFTGKPLVEHFSFWIEPSWNDGLNVIHISIPFLHQNFDEKQSASCDCIHVFPSDARPSDERRQ